MVPKELLQIFQKIRLVIFDVDGVLTDGKLFYGENGECLKVFNARDGLGIRRLIQYGFQVAIITGRESSFVLKRAKDLGIQNVYQNRMEKLAPFEELRSKLSLDYAQVAYMGDDWIDLPVMKIVGCAACPNDAMPCVKRVAHFTSCFNGGCGAAREFCDAIWEAQHSCDI